jgi:hypothetical protein
VGQRDVPAGSRLANVGSCSVRPTVAKCRGHIPSNRVAVVCPDRRHQTRYSAHAREVARNRFVSPKKILNKRGHMP